MACGSRGSLVQIPVHTAEFLEIHVHNSFEMYHEPYSEDNYREKTGTNMRSNSVVCVEYLTSIGWARGKLRSKPLYGKIGWDDDDI